MAREWETEWEAGWDVIGSSGKVLLDIKYSLSAIKFMHYESVFAVCVCVCVCVCVVRTPY